LNLVFAIGKSLNRPTRLGVYSNWAGETKLENTKALPTASTNRIEMVHIHSHRSLILSSEFIWQV